jgi:hypothetical protein
MDRIAFNTEFTLIREVNNYATSIHENFTSEVVILASNSLHTVGVLAKDAPSATSVPESKALFSDPAALSGPGFLAQPAFVAYPNPFSAKTTISFTLSVDGDYSLALYDGNQVQVVFQKQGKARAGEINTIEVDGGLLGRGLYLARLQTGNSSQTLRLMLDR